MIRRTKQRATLLGSFATALVLLAILTQPVCGADIQMEIFYLPHRPALAVVSKIENVAAEFKNINLKKYNFDDPDTEKLIKKYDLGGHMPVAIFINGQNSFPVNGREIVLRNFPKGDPFVPMFAGEWDYEDLKAILQDISGGK
jgi:hypothetical protein